MPTRELLTLDADPGWRFAVVHRPESEPVGGVLLAPPFAEEMNRCRRQLSLAAAAFAAKGWLVVSVDLLGTGDSSGDFGDASWDAWIGDLDLGAGWLSSQLPSRAPVVGWGVRAGALLVGEWVRRRGRSTPTLLWQPQASGPQVLTQFLRLKAVGEMLDGAEARQVVKRTREKLMAGAAVEVAGYALSTSLARGLEDANLEADDGLDPTLIVEIDATGSPAPVTRTLADGWVARGADVSVLAVPGAPFWRTQAVTTSVEMIEVSLPFLDRLSK